MSTSWIEEYSSHPEVLAGEYAACPVPISWDKGCSAHKEADAVLGLQFWH